ncbi:hypothetical protein ACT3UM_06905 [Halomonas sp. AOP13-D3-9]
MSQFEFTINGTTLTLTADDVVKLEAAMVDAAKSPNRKAFRKGSTGEISAKWLDGQHDGLERFNRHQPSAEILTDC